MIRIQIKWRGCTCPVLPIFGDRFVEFTQEHDVSDTHAYEYNIRLDESSD